jgi:adenylate kinase family enzyme
MRERKKFILIIGNVGSGKTTLCRGLARFGYQPLFIDDYYAKVKRRNLKVPWFEDKKYMDKTYQIFYSAILKQLRKKHVVADSTGVNLRWGKILKKLEKKHVHILRLYLKVPKIVAKERLRRRNRMKKQKHTKLSLVDYITKRMKQVKPKIDCTVNGNKKPSSVIKEVLKILERI